MWNPFKKYIHKKILKFESLLIDQKYKIEPAFILGNIQYYQFSSAMDLPASRGLSAMAIYEEFRAKAGYEYLTKHVEATNLILNGGPDGKSIDLNKLRLINQNLGERINLAALPDHCYRLASVHFFTAEESIYQYDYKYNEEKIKKWKQSPEALSFFLTGPLRSYLPFTNMPKKDALTFLNTVDLLDQLHQKDLSDTLSKKI